MTSETKTRLYVGKFSTATTIEDVEFFLMPVARPKQILLKEEFAFVVWIIFVWIVVKSSKNSEFGCSEIHPFV